LRPYGASVPAAEEAASPLEVADGALIVYDVTSPESLASVQRWEQEVLARAPAGIPIVLVGNKACRESGSPAPRRVSTDQVWSN